MILSMRMQNLALIESLSIDFSEGLHVMTGETGAGKSIVVDAVNLVLGGRADRDLIRTGTDRAWVEAVFDVTGNIAVAALLESQHLEAEGGVVTLYREITRSGRNLCRVCGVTLPLAYLREMAALLMDVHGQHEHQFLMDPKRHLQFLDAFGDEAHQVLLHRVSDAWSVFIQNHRSYAKLLRENQQRNDRIEVLKHALDELKKAKLKPGEEETLLRERERFRQAEKVNGAVQEAYGVIATSEASDPLLTKLKEAVDALNRLTPLGEPYTAIASRCENAYYELQEIGYDLAQILESGDYDPFRAEQVDSRLDVIHRLKQRYGATVADVLAEQERMQEEYDHLSTLDQQVAKKKLEQKRLLSQYRELARTLTQAREALARTFEQNMMAQLKDLGMEKTVLQVAFAPKPEDKPQMPRQDGDDTVEFMICPNPGEPLKPLSKIASGGELSRLMLAIKSIEAEKGGVGCMVFDEIDTGISGRMAQVVAEKMADIARKRQVLCVTHLPQIAAMADAHLYVEKRVTDGRTSTSVRLLAEEEHIGEVARMMGGAGDSQESAISHAATMVAQAKRRHQA